MFRESFAMFADGAAEIVKWARLCCREGADNIKLNVSGDDLYGPPSRDDRDERGGDPRRRRGGARLPPHGQLRIAARRNRVKRAVRCGVDVIYHCEHADTEALDLLEGEKHRVFVGPAIGLLYAVRESLTAAGADPSCASWSSGR